MAKKPTPQKKPVKKPDEETEETEETEEGEEETGDEDNDRKINAIVTNRVNRALKPLTKTIEALTAKIAEMSQAKTSSEEETDEEIEEETTKSKGKSKPNKQLSALEKRVKDAEERAAAAEKAQTEAAEKAQRQEENSAIGAALAKSGISDQRVIRAVTLSLREDGLIIRDEETGKIKFKTVDKHGYEDLVEPEVGLVKWLKADGKSFLPAVSAGGSGAGGPNMQANSQRTNLNKQEHSKLSAREKAAIDLERASSGLPPLES